MCVFSTGIIVKLSQQGDHSYSYNTVTVVLLTEATKLFASLLIYLKEYVYIFITWLYKQDICVLLAIFLNKLLKVFCKGRELIMYNKHNSNLEMQLLMLRIYC